MDFPLRTTRLASSIGAALLLCATASRAEPTRPECDLASDQTDLAPVAVNRVIVADRPSDAAASPSPEGSSRAPDEPNDDPMDYTTRRLEPAGFPFASYSNDYGTFFGVAGTLSRFERGLRPYYWNMDLVIAASIYNNAGNASIGQMNFRWQWDIRGFFHGRLRLNPAAYYQRTLDQGYYGIGNASSGVTPTNTLAPAGRFFEVQLDEVRAFMQGYIVLRGPLMLSLAAVFRYMGVSPYRYSRLDLDSQMTNPDGTPYIYGAQHDASGNVNPLFLPEISAIMIYDSRDSEIMPAHGLMHQLSIRYVQGFPLDASVAYGAANLSLAQYVTIGGPFVFASRFLADAEFGNVPFYDLLRGGTPFPQDMPGGGGAVRGVPSGRYLGKIKMALNVEIRALLFGFHLFDQSFRVGANIFFDTGRVWTDWTFHNPLDGTGLGLKYGVGLGAYVRWGQAAIFRAEIAYSPDQQTASPGFPFAIYVSDGVMF